MTLDLFAGGPAGEPGNPGPAAPLADRLRPRQLDGMLGQDDLIGPGRFLRRLVEQGELPSLLFWGPPGSGKTTLAAILAGAVRADFVGLSAVTAGVREIREIVARAEGTRRSASRRTILFIDEIHRFNKAQQDVLLPHVERGTLTLIGATTENPSFEVNSALLSRVRVVTLKALGPEDLSMLADRALADGERGLGSRRQTLEPAARQALVAQADGDARRLLNVLESASGLTPEGGVIVARTVREALQSRTLLFDREGEEHYNIISALHKSVRDSDPDAALYWLARMLEAGEDRLFVARRLIRAAVEDVGLADPQAMVLAVAARDVAHFLGEPEGDLALAEIAVYLALAPKSNAVYTAYGEAVSDAGEKGSLPVPLHLRNAPTGLMASLGYGAGYRYAHDSPGHVVDQEHFPPELSGGRYYRPGDQGVERKLGERLSSLRARWQAAREAASRPPSGGDD